MYFWVIMLLGVALYIFFDANKRHNRTRFAFMWLAATLFLPYIAIPLYFITRKSPMNSRNTTKNAVLTDRALICSKCGYENSNQDAVCAKCNNNLQVG
jgi:hypothetical protein